MFRASSAHLQEVSDINCTCMQHLVLILCNLCTKIMYKVGINKEIVHVSVCFSTNNWYSKSTSTTKLSLLLSIMISSNIRARCHLVCTHRHQFDKHQTLQIHTRYLAKLYAILDNRELKFIQIMLM